MMNILLLAAAMASGSAQIPAAFQGEWNGTLKACGKDTSDSKLVVTGSQVAFYESTGKVKKVTVQGPQAITVKASFHGEGETWDKDEKMVLTRGGQDLAITDDGGTMTRHRCPMKKR